MKINGHPKIDFDFTADWLVNYANEHWIVHNEKAFSSGRNGHILPPCHLDLSGSMGKGLELR